MEKKILAISGRKQAGKDTCYKFLRSLLERPDYQDWLDGKQVEIGHFYFADALKRMCIDILGCPEDKVYGTDDDKNTKVAHLLWENFPVAVYHNDRTDKDIVKMSDDPDYLIDGINCIRKTGPMSVREILQYYGTEIFRRQYHDVWADACIRKIDRSDCDLAVITDCRFPNEVDATKRAGGKVIRLTRVMFPGDRHISETSLDRYEYDWSLFDEVIDNQGISVEGLCFRLYLTLRDWGWLPDIPVRDIRMCYPPVGN
jgi:hypothetical protein